jgi:hypothetical protein
VITVFMNRQQRCFRHSCCEIPLTQALAAERADYGGLGCCPSRKSAEPLSHIIASFQMSVAIASGLPTNHSMLLLTDNRRIQPRRGSPH